MPDNTCPECGPHGGQGRVLLLESWVDCTLCRRPSPAADLADQMAADGASADIAARANRRLAAALQAAKNGRIVLADGSIADLKDGQHVQGCSCSGCSPKPRYAAGVYGDTIDQGTGTRIDLFRALNAHGIFGASIYEDSERRTVVIVVDEPPELGAREDVGAILPITVAVEFAVRETR